MHNALETDADQAKDDERDHTYSIDEEGEDFDEFDDDDDSGSNELQKLEEVKESSE
jgi:hypothetical protein